MPRRRPAARLSSTSPRTPNSRTAAQRSRGRRAVRRRVARPLRDRRVDLPGRAGRRAGAAQRRRRRRGARDLPRPANVPVLPRGAGSSQCGQTVGAALVIDHSKHLNRVIAFDADAMTVTVEPGIVLDAAQCVAAAEGRLVSRSTSARRRRPRWAAWPATTPAARARSPTATWCTTSSAIDATLSDGTQRALRPRAPTMAGAPARVRHAGRRARPHRRARARRDRAAGAEGDAPRRRLQHRRLPSAERAALHRRRQRQLRASAGRQRRHARVEPRTDAASSRRCRAHRTLGVVNFPTLPSRDGMRAAPRRASDLSAVELVDRTMIDLARGNPAFRPVIDAALIGAPDAILLVEFTRDDARRRGARPRPARRS